MTTGVRVNPVSANEMEHLRRQAKAEVVGLPVYVDAETLRRIVWPLPDDDFELVVFAMSKQS